MGLDMYLRGKRFISDNFNKGDSEKAEAIQQLFPELEGMTGRFGSLSPIQEIMIDAGYWRKANSIHNWFVQNVQGGVDNCGFYYISRDQLKELRDICQQVLDEPSLSEELLPPRAGFFFGNTDIDDSYFADLKYTIRILDKALSMPKSWDFEYHSSW